MNGYEYIWSPEVFDFYSDKLETETFPKGITSEEFMKNSDEFEYDIKKIIGHYTEVVNTYRNKNLRLAIKTGNEITFKCKKYYLINDINIIDAIFHKGFRYEID